MRYTTRPLSDRTWLRADDERTRSQFKVSWSQASDLLERELEWIDGHDLVIEIDIREQDLRLDGMLRANAKPIGAPAVVVAFESQHGPLLYRSDAYGWGSWGSSMEVWQHNVYAVAKTLEALRAVDRYGAARSGEQYRGYRQIGRGPAIVTDAPMTARRAAEILVRGARVNTSERTREHDVDAFLDGDLDRDSVIRLAKRNTHPDTAWPGIPVSFDEVQRAAAHLRGER
ncbi:hypothetical protein [Cellulomonas rhizosphaerae]|uniref:Uncharacterized protein n=1 Tax=Cellulomonas rhizosphaerae TaxID=2293719 RepID=A0A413RJC3_9CELL|nr:hypothetical protein [Cellulomonas rhizosphaerae]RHA38695.1 hypothetical protein D1825_13250 [Cellulomonas rhizosphaerae]